MCLTGKFRCFERLLGSLETRNQGWFMFYGFFRIILRRVTKSQGLLSIDLFLTDYTRLVCLSSPLEVHVYRMLVGNS